jgi:hypothetical protein
MRLAAALALALLLFIAAACSSSNAGSCNSDAQCPTGKACAYRMSDGCSAAGECVTKSPVRCNLVVPACACDGTGVDVSGCDGFPDGYVAKPFAHRGAC